MTTFEVHVLGFVIALLHCYTKAKMLPHTILTPNSPHKTFQVAKYLPVVLTSCKYAGDLLGLCSNGCQGCYQDRLASSPLRSGTQVQANFRSIDFFRLNEEKILLDMWWGEVTITIVKNYQPAAVSCRL